MVCRRRSPGQERSSIKTEVAVRGFVELRPAEHPVDAYRQPSTKRRSAKPRAATSSSIPARLISRAAMDDEMIPAPRSGFNPLPHTNHLPYIVQAPGTPPPRCHAATPRKPRRSPPVHRLQSIPPPPLAPQYAPPLPRRAFSPSRLARPRLALRNHCQRA